MIPFFSRMFPGTNLQDLNLDWICRRIMELSKGIIAPWINPDTKNWMVYDTETEQFVDSGVTAQGDPGPELDLLEDRVDEIENAITERMYYDPRVFTDVYTQNELNTVLDDLSTKKNGVFVTLHEGTYTLNTISNIAPLFENVNLHFVAAENETVTLDLKGSVFYTAHINIQGVTIINSSNDTSRIENGYSLFTNCTILTTIGIRGGAVSYGNCVFRYSAESAWGQSLVWLLETTAALYGCNFVLTGAPTGSAIFSASGSIIATRSSMGFSRVVDSGNTYYIFRGSDGNIANMVLWNGGASEYETGTGSYNASKRGEYETAITNLPLIFYYTNVNVSYLAKANSQFIGLSQQLTSTSLS